MWYMHVETDDDFIIEFRGDHYYGDFTLTIKDVSELSEMIILNRMYGPRSEHTKCWEFEHDIARILKNPDEDFDSTGGNRGMIWNKLS